MYTHPQGVQAGSEWTTPAARPLGRRRSAAAPSPHASPTPGSPHLHALTTSAPTTTTTTTTPTRTGTTAATPACADPPPTPPAAATTTTRQMSKGKIPKVFFSNFLWILTNFLYHFVCKNLQIFVFSVKSRVNLYLVNKYVHIYKF